MGQTKQGEKAKTWNSSISLIAARKVVSPRSLATVSAFHGEPPLFELSTGEDFGSCPVCREALYRKKHSTETVKCLVSSGEIWCSHESLPSSSHLFSVVEALQVIISKVCAFVRVVCIAHALPTTKLSRVNWGCFAGDAAKRSTQIMTPWQQPHLRKFHP